MIAQISNASVERGLMRQHRTFIVITVAVILCATALFHAQILALSWHLKNGRNVIWNGHSVALPLLWKPSLGSNAATLILRRAGSEDELVFREKGISIDAEQASIWQKNSVDALNSKRSSTSAFEAYTVVTNDGDVFCIDSGEQDSKITFACKVVGQSFDVGFAGVTGNVLDARAIVSSLN